jgi:hypothetical protein
MWEQDGNSAGAASMDNDDYPPVEELEMSPEAARFIQMQYEIDREAAGRKAPVSGFEYKGVRIESRWSVLYELDQMKRVVDALELSARRIGIIWCDSNAGSTFSVTVRSGRWNDDLRWAISDAFRSALGGHNGIYVEAEGGGCTIEPFWDEPCD